MTLGLTAGRRIRCPLFNCASTIRQASHKLKFGRLQPVRARAAEVGLSAFALKRRMQRRHLVETRGNSCSIIIICVLSKGSSSREFLAVDWDRAEPAFRAQHMHAEVYWRTLHEQKLMVLPHNILWSVQPDRMSVRLQRIDCAAATHVSTAPYRVTGDRCARTESA